MWLTERYTIPETSEARTRESSEGAVAIWLTVPETARVARVVKLNCPPKETEYDKEINIYGMNILWHCAETPSS